MAVQHLGRYRQAALGGNVRGLKRLLVSPLDFYKQFFWCDLELAVRVSWMLQEKVILLRSEVCGQGVKILLGSVERVASFDCVISPSLPIIRRKKSIFPVSPVLHLLLLFHGTSKDLSKNLNLTAREVRCTWQVLPGASTIQIKRHILKCA